MPGSTITSSLRYFHHDQLGSVAAVTDEVGSVIERMAYDPWGKRRGVDGVSDVADSLVGRTTDRGFTEHEHLDEMGLVHMNGRIYDPLVGRFMSADPFIQAPSMLQSYNRYAYVMNNPLNLTDPSGYSWWTRAMHLGDRISSIGVSLGSSALYHRSVNFLSGSGGYQLKSAALGYVSLYCGPWVAACNGGFQAALAKGYGASDGDAFRAGAVAAISTGAFQLAGQVTPGDSSSFLRYAAHAGAGCVSSVAGGGNCGQGAVSAVFGKFATNAIGATPGEFNAYDAAATVVAGGVGSVIAGGKFENGAKTAAYGYLFNNVLTVVVATVPLAIGVASQWDNIKAGWNALLNGLGNVMMSEGGATEVPSNVGPGPNAGESVPAGPSSRPTKEQQDKINEIGNRDGCHTCGSKDPGTKLGNWVGDHQDPTKLNPDGKPQRYYPQCQDCSNQQGGRIRWLPKP